MNDTRARFEEIWPVPEEIFWFEGKGEYWPVSNGPYDAHIAEQWDARLDTFTRCQETTDVYVSLIGEMVADIEYLIELAAGNEPYSTACTLKRAKQIMGDKK